jgi:tetratricopeptide (TPR) repeat protein
MDCDDVMLVLARGDITLAPDQVAAFEDHVSDCEGCSELVSRRSRDAPWAAVGSYRLPIVEPARFELYDVIATGGMGKITRAFDHHLAREVAIKEALAPEFRGRFEREAAITARLQHPAIVPIYEAGTWPDGGPFYTMRLIHGRTLADAIAAAPALAQRLELVAAVGTVGDALAYAHSLAIIHRDLKPTNVLVGEFGETVLIDWGLAKHLDEAAPAASAEPTSPHVTTAGLVIGTPCFMAPEQARGDELDERADVFALGALLYNVLTGTPPYWDQSRDSKELIAAVQTRSPTPIRTLAPEAPVDLCAIVERAMARDRAARFANAGAMVAELKRFQAGQLLASREYRVRELLARWLRRHRTAVAVTGVAAIVVAVGGAIAMREVTRANEVADSAFERGQRKLCASEAPALAGPWDAKAKGLVTNAFATTKLPFVADTLARVDANLTHWTADLEVSRDLLCVPNVPRTRLAAELACLADRARDARALVNQFANGDNAPTVLNAVAATEQLAPASRCLDTFTQPAAPTASHATDELQTEAAQAHALMALGNFKAAVPFAQKAVASANALGDPGLRADALVTLGAAQTESSDLDGALATLQQALELADVAREDRLRAQAWNNLVHTQYLRGQFEQVVAMRAPALGAIDRIGDVKLATDTKLNIAGALGQLGKPGEARPLFEEVVAQRRAAYGEHDYRLGTALSALGNAYSMQGELAKGIAAHQAAVATVEAALGPNHPTTGVMHGNLGDDYLYALRFEEAIGELTKDVAILERVDPKQRKLANALTDLGTAQLEAGHAEQALATFERADALWTDVAAKHPGHSDAMLGRYLASRALGKPVAIADLEAALALAEHLPPFERARIQLALGTALTGPRAFELVQAAATGFATSPLPLCQRDLATAKAWLAAHPKG